MKLTRDMKNFEILALKAIKKDYSETWVSAVQWNRTATLLIWPPHCYGFLIMAQTKAQSGIFLKKKPFNKVAPVIQICMAHW